MLCEQEETQWQHPFPCPPSAPPTLPLSSLGIPMVPATSAVAPELLPDPLSTAGDPWMLARLKGTAGVCTGSRRII
jgi:hypothetical protein